MNTADFVFLSFLALGAYMGFRKGLMLEIVTFLALIIGIISAFKLLNSGIEFIRSTWGWESILIPYLAFILIFVLVFLLIHLLGKTLKKILDFTLLGSADNFAGALLGVAKMAFGISLILWLTRAASIELPPAITENSLLFTPLVGFAPGVVHWISYVIPFQDIFPAISKILTDSN